MKTKRFKVWDEKFKHMVSWEKVKYTPLLIDAFDGKDAVALQYSGIDDKNQKEICEGDIVKYRLHEGEGIIEFYAGIFFCTWDDQTDDELGYMLTDDLQVIGNIYEK